MEPFRLTKTYVLFIVALLFVALLLVGALYFVGERKEEQALQESSAGAALRTESAEVYTDMEGNSLQLDEYLGQVIVANAWASWSPFSKTELPNLARLQREFSDRGVVVLAINRGEQKTTAESFLRLVSAYEDVTLVLDTEDHYYTSIDGYAMPETVFYDVKGNIVHQARGQLTYEDMKTFTEDALEASVESP